MENTVVGVYDSYTQAQNAMNELLAHGFSRSNVQISPNVEEEHGSASEGSGISHFFRALFGMEEHHEHRDIYSEAVRRGGIVVAVDTDTDHDRERATEILSRFYPADIEERAAHWRSQGWSGYDDAAPRMTQNEIEDERRKYGRSSAEDAVSGSSDAAALNVAAEGMTEGGTREPMTDEMPRSSVRTYPRSGQIPSRAIDDISGAQPAAPRGTDFADTRATAADSDFRSHWQSAYGQSGRRYEDYDAAYRYGTSIAGSGRYQNYRWEDAEPQMRSEWELRHPESTWEQVKDAVRYGAERVTGKEQRH